MWLRPKSQCDALKRCTSITEDLQPFKFISYHHNSTLDLILTRFKGALSIAEYITKLLRPVFILTFYVQPSLFQIYNSA
jgi:hypothetical protein